MNNSQINTNRLRDSRIDNTMTNSISQYWITNKTLELECNNMSSKKIIKVIITMISIRTCNTSKTKSQMFPTNPGFHHMLLPRMKINILSLIKTHITIKTTKIMITIIRVITTTLNLIDTQVMCLKLKAIQRMVSRPDYSIKCHRIPNTARYSWEDSHTI